MTGDQKERGRWMVIRRTSGRVVELSTVFVPANVKPRRNKRRGTTTAQKQDENERDCVKRLARAINCNFAHGDLWLTAKYDDAGIARLEAWARAHQKEGQSWEDAMFDAAEQAGTNYLRRLKRLLEKQGVELRSIISTSDMDGASGEHVRLHHHIILPRVSFEAAAKAWKDGSVEYQILRDQQDYTPLAVYICKQARRRPDRKKFRCSRHLKKPIVNERWAKPGEELRPDAGGAITGRNQWEPGKPQYIRFVKRDPLPAGRGRRKREGAQVTEEGSGGKTRKARKRE